MLSSVACLLRISNKPCENFPAVNKIHTHLIHKYCTHIFCMHIYYMQTQSLEKVVYIHFFKKLKS